MTLDIYSGLIFGKAVVNGVVIGICCGQGAISSRTRFLSSFCLFSKITRRQTNEAEKSLIELCLAAHEVEYLTHILFELLLSARQLVLILG